MPDERTLRSRVALAAASVVALVLVLEVSGRLWLGARGEEFGTPFWVLDPELGARMKPGYRGPDDRGLPVEINSRGLRNPEVALPKPPGRVRIVAMGDSVTYGFGVAEAETFSRRLETELRALGDRDVEVVNAGVPGYSTYQGLVHFERDVLALEPDVVLFAYMNNDRWDSRGDVHTADAIRAGYDDIRLRSWFFYHSALGRMVIRFQAGGLDGVLKAAPPRRSGAKGRTGGGATDTFEPPERLALEPVAADHPRLRQLAGFRDLIPTVSPADRRALCERAAELASEHDVRLVFVHFYDHPYMSEPLRRAAELMGRERPAEALTELLEYFTTPPIPKTSAASPMDFDLLANDLLDRVYDAIGRGPDERPHYFPRRPYRRHLLHLDTTYNRIATEVAEQRGLEVLELRELEPADYIDHIHLTPRGHARVAARLAELLR